VASASDGGPGIATAVEPRRRHLISAAGCSLVSVPVRRKFHGAALLGAAVAVVSGPALASRKPTAMVAKEIRASALFYLRGKGWIVSGIRVSTANGNYAKAAVHQGANGPGGEMILNLRHGIWHGFCSAKAPKKVLDELGFAC
jgi:hypothetical protein